MEKLTCIVCPRGCTLNIENNGGEFAVTGNYCKRGEKFARDEMTCPKRTVCTTVKTVFPGVPVLPVRVSAEIPKNRIFDVMKEINAFTLTERAGRGDVVIANVCGLDSDVIVTSNILKR